MLPLPLHITFSDAATTPAVCNAILGRPLFHVGIFSPGVSVAAWREKIPRRQSLVDLSWKDEVDLTGHLKEMPNEFVWTTLHCRISTYPVGVGRIHGFPNPTIMLNVHEYLPIPLFYRCPQKLFDLFCILASPWSSSRPLISTPCHEQPQRSM